MLLPRRVSQRRFIHEHAVRTAQVHERRLSIVELYHQPVALALPQRLDQPAQPLGLQRLQVDLQLALFVQRDNVCHVRPGLLRQADQHLVSAHRHVLDALADQRLDIVSLQQPMALHPRRSLAVASIFRCLCCIPAAEILINEDPLLSIHRHNSV